MAFDAETTVFGDVQSSSRGRIRLVIVGADFVRTVEFGTGETLRIGRGEGNDLVLADNRLSRSHAEIRREPLRVTDLGSANGTSMAGRRIEPNVATPFLPGTPVDLGGVILLAQSVDAQQPRGLSTHAYFEARLDEEVRRRGRDARSPFSILFVRLSGEGEAEVERVLTSKLGPLDAVASFAPNEYEILLLDAAPTRAEAVADQLREEFDASSISAEVGLANFPSDGLNGQVLIAHARGSLNGEILPESSTVVVEDSAMRAVYQMVERIARGTITVLLTGETGSGKEVLADAIHDSSPRKQGPMMRINCAALSESLVESELFGHLKGAFTGALRDKAGLIEAGSGGTVLLDEVGELPITTQAKLLRVLETGRVRPLGSVEEITVDARFIAATNRDLLHEVDMGTFREDLYYRLSGVCLHVPPLRERPGDIAPLVEMFVRRFSAELGIPPLEVDDEANSLLRSYRWPGNIRELRNTLERAVLLADGVITPDHLPREKMTAAWRVQRKATARTRKALTAEGEATRSRIEAALEKCAGNQTRAAQELGVSRQTLANWLDRYDIPRPRRPRR